MSVRFTVDYPPSTNRLWRNVNGRMLLSEAARDYKARIGWLAKAAGATVTAGRVAVTMWITCPRRNADMDNAIKICLDGMQGVVYADDKQVAELHCYRADDPKRARVEIEVREL